MQYEQVFSNLIYEYFVMRFRFQYYRYGETLPSIDTLCRQFSVSPLTVKTALQRLHKEEYVRIHHGRSTKVVFRQSQEELDEFTRSYFSGRQAVFTDLYQSTEFVFLPLLTEGLGRMEENDFAYLARLAQRADSDDLVRFYCLILQKTENPLVMNLFWETALFMGFPFPTQQPAVYDRPLIRQRLQQLLACARAGTPPDIHKAHLAFQRDVAKEFTAFVGQSVPTAAQEEQVCFTWRIYRERPQICYSLAVLILHEINMGEYQNEQYLPSYDAMAEKYGVSVSTVRRTVRILNQIGAARSVNGKGTRIDSLCGSGCQPDFAAPAVRRNLGHFIQAFHILALSCGEVTRMVLSSLTGREKEDLTNLLEGFLRTGQCSAAPLRYFAFLAGHSPLRGIHEIYGKLYALLLWGYPLKAVRHEHDEQERRFTRFTREMAGHLKRNEFDRCAETIEEFMNQGYPIAEAYLLDCGLQPEELRLSPSFKLLSAEE